MTKPKPSRLLSALRGLFWAALALALLLSLILLGFALAAHGRETRDRIEAAPKTGRFVSAGDVDLFIQEAGPASAPAVVLIHGLAGWGELWRGTLDELGAHKLHVIAVDMPPLGYSQKPDNDAYSSEDQAKRLLAMMDSLKLKRAAVVGHSFGAGAAVAAALMAPKRVSALVIADGALPGPGAPRGTPSVSTPALLRWITDTPAVRDALIAATLANPALTRRLLAQFCADSSCATDARVEALRRPLEVQGAVAGFGRFLPQLIRGDPPPDYRKLSMPVLLLWGQADVTTPLALGAAIKDTIPGAKLVVIAHAGHMLPIEQTAAFDAQVLAFLASQKGKK